MTKEDNKKPNSIGKEFESKVENELRLLREEFPLRVFYEKHFRITLNDGNDVYPDFHVEFLKTSVRSHSLIECQNRCRNSMAIYHKIKHIKNNSKYNNFIYVYPDEATPKTCDALKGDGVICFSLTEFNVYLKGVRLELSQTSIRQNVTMPDKRMTIEKSKHSAPSRIPEIRKWTRPFEYEQVYATLPGPRISEDTKIRDKQKKRNGLLSYLLSLFSLERIKKLFRS